MTEPVLRGREVGAPMREKVDVVIVGSGAGGAVAARELARAGLSVLVLEEGGHYTPEEYGALPPTQSIRRIATIATRQRDYAHHARMVNQGPVVICPCRQGQLQYDLSVVWKLIKVR